MQALRRCPHCCTAVSTLTPQDAVTPGGVTIVYPRWRHHRLRLWEWILAGLLVGVFGLLIAAAYASPSQSAQETSQQDSAPVATSGPSSAYMLATLQSGYDIGQDDPLVTQFQNALDSVAPKCQESENRISDYTVATHDILQQHGLDDSYLSILTDVQGSIPDSIGSQRCADIFAAWATLRTGG